MLTSFNREDRPLNNPGRPNNTGCELRELLDATPASDRHCSRNTDAELADMGIFHAFVAAKLQLRTKASRRETENRCTDPTSSGFRYEVKLI